MASRGRLGAQVEVDLAEKEELYFKVEAEILRRISRNVTHIDNFKRFFEISPTFPLYSPVQVGPVDGVGPKVGPVELPARRVHHQTGGVLAVGNLGIGHQSVTVGRRRLKGSVIWGKQDVQRGL